MTHQRCATLLLFSLLLCGAATPSYAQGNPAIDGVMAKLEPLFAKKKYDQIIKEAEKAVASLKDSQNQEKAACYTYIAEAWYAKGDKARAYAALERIADPESEIYVLVRASFKTRDGQVRAAFDECRAAATRMDAQKRPLVEKKCRQIYAKMRLVSAKVLWDAFNTNAIAAEDAYKGKLVAVEGKISKIGTSPMGYPELTFAIDGFGLKSVRCQFSKEARPEIAKLKKGQSVTVGGLCKGFVMDSQVSMDSCELY